MTVYKIQPAECVDRIHNGHEMTKLPKPYFVNADDGAVGRQDYWQGDPAAVVGFQADLAVNRIDLTWQEAAADPARAVGMYLVTTDSEGAWSTHLTAVASMAVSEGTHV